MVVANRLSRRWERLTECCIVLIAASLALCVARPYAGSWNDGSRLASVECLIDRHTWVIDQSVFVQPTSANNPITPLPYPSGDVGLNTHGTLDKMYIAGHFYSDKSPVPALLLAGFYGLWQCATGWTARVQPDHFCRGMTWVSSGMAYLIAVWCVYRVGSRLRLSLALRILLTGSFALATVALPYTQHVNNHILLLGVTSALVLEVVKMRDRAKNCGGLWRHCLFLGCLAGFAYTIDLGVGPVIFVCTGSYTVLYVLSAGQALTLVENPTDRSVAGQFGVRSGDRSLYGLVPVCPRLPRIAKGGNPSDTAEVLVLISFASRNNLGLPTCEYARLGNPLADNACQRATNLPNAPKRPSTDRLIRVIVSLFSFAAASLPWLVLHHALNYWIGGTLQPANANPGYFRWPGSPFAAGNLTGSWIHQDIGSFFLYAASMLVGKRGFLGHNLPLFLTLPGFVLLLRSHKDVRRDVAWALACCAGTWLLYAATSNNSSGQCCTIRWFVPLLAPGYYVIALFLQRYPQSRLDFLLLSVWGVVLVLLMRDGPWMSHMVAYFWPIQAATFLSWVLCVKFRQRLNFP